MTTKRYIFLLITFFSLVVLIVLGSVLDLAIAKGVYLGETPTENLLGVLCAYIGVIPTFVGWSFLGASIFALTKKQIQDTKKRRILFALALLLCLLSFFYFPNTLYFTDNNPLGVPLALAYEIGVPIIFLAALLGYRLSQKSEDGELFRKVLLLTAVSLITLLIISVSKGFMCRPRFRLLLSEANPDYFRNWWQNGRALKASLDTGAPTDEFASFPSGHSAYAMFAVLLFPALADYVRSLGKWKPVLTLLGFLWWGAIALSRMSVGAHYLTDVAFGAMIPILSYLIVQMAKRAYRRRRECKINPEQETHL